MTALTHKYQAKKKFSSFHLFVESFQSICAIFTIPNGRFTFPHTVMYHNPNHSLLALLLLLLLLPIIPTFPSSTNSSLSNLHKSIIHIFNFTRRRRFALSGTKVFFFLFVYLFIWPHLQPPFFQPSVTLTAKGPFQPTWVHTRVWGWYQRGREEIYCKILMCNIFLI